MSASALQNVVVAIPSWNGRKHLETCLPALLDQRHPGVPWRVLVFDNGSTDGTREWLQKHHPDVECLHSEANLGFCAASNRLVEASAADAVALLNNDTRPHPEWLACLVDAMAAAPADVAAISGRIVDWSGERLDFGRGIMTFDGHAFQLDYRRPLKEARVPKDGEELLFACGGNAMVRRDAFLDAGGFDERYFAYLEDVDLGWRWWARGLRVLFSEQAVVHHRSMATSNLLGDHNRGFLFERNALLTVLKNFDETSFAAMMPAVLVTLESRTASLLAETVPGGEAFCVDPFQGAVANTARSAPDERAPVDAAEGALGRWRRRLRDYGPRELVARSLIRLAAIASPSSPLLLPRQDRGSRLSVSIGESQVLSQLRVLQSVKVHRDQTMERRSLNLAARRRSDREIFERFPLWLVPTYLGDEELFASPGFEALWPDRETHPSLAPRRARLREVMETEG